MYNSVFDNNIIYVVENMTNLLSAYLKEELGLSVKSFQKGLTMDTRKDIGVYKGTSSFISDMYTTICDNVRYDFYLCLDPGVLIFDYVLSSLKDIPFRTYLGARTLATKPIRYTDIRDEKVLLGLSLLYRDLGKGIGDDFCSFSSKMYSKVDYGVLLCRRDYLLNVGLFESVRKVDFVHTATHNASFGQYDVEYSHDLYTYKKVLEAK